MLWVTQNIALKNDAQKSIAEEVDTGRWVKASIMPSVFF